MIELIVAIAVLGVIVWAVTTLVPMPDKMKNAIYVIAVVCVVFYVLYAFGFHGFHDADVPQILH